MPLVPTVLMVDDNPGDCGLVRQAIVDCGVGVDFHSVANAPQVFAFLGRRGKDQSLPLPDLIILDLRLPVMDGRQILEVLQSDPVWRSIAVVILSSSGLSSDRQEAVERGARGYFLKPTLWKDYPPLVRCLEKHWSRGEEQATPSGSHSLH